MTRPPEQTALPSIHEQDGWSERQKGLIRAMLAPRDAEIDRLKQNFFSRDMDCQAKDIRIAELEEKLMVLLAVQLKRFQEPEAVPAPTTGAVEGEADGRANRSG